MTVFAYRSPYEGPLSKCVRRLRDPSVLDWFRRGWDEARDDADAWVERELGVDVYGLDSIFEQAVQHRLPKPATWQELRDLLGEHLYVEGEVRVSDGSVRALTDDDEVPLAYYFFDDELARVHLDRVAYHLHADWPLPAAGADRGAKPGTTVVSSCIDGDWGAEYRVVHFAGVRVAEFAHHLRRTPVDGSWPAELIVLRALIAADNDLHGALRRLNHWTAFADEGFDTTGLRDDHADAHRTAAGAVDGDGPTLGPFGSRRPELSRIEVADHLLQMAMHLSDAFGHRHLFAFDDFWAEAHPTLASSLVRYANHWDPLQPDPPNSPPGHRAPTL